MTRLRSPAFARNRDPILEVLERRWRGLSPARVLELGSGPGQHVCYFAQRLEGVHWQPSERAPELLASIDAWRDAEGVAERVAAPILLDVTEAEPAPEALYGGVLAINVLHMVGPEVVRALLDVAARGLARGGELVVYDCFTYEGEHVAPSNVRFDAMLRQSTPGGRVYAIEEVSRWAAERGLMAPEVSWLPANNQCVAWTLMS